MNKKLLNSTVKLADANGNMVDIPVESIYTLLTSEDGSVEGIAEYDEYSLPIDEIRHNLFNDIADTLHGSWDGSTVETYVFNLCTLLLEIIKDGTISKDDDNYRKIVMAVLKEKANEYDKGTVEYMVLKAAIAVVKDERAW